MHYSATDLTGQRFGRLVAVEPTNQRKNKYVVWRCKCDCGNEALVSSYTLRRGFAQSCGCARFADITGQRFGKLVAIEPTAERRYGSVVWRCKCDCGGEINAPARLLKHGDIISCGCRRYNPKYSNLIGKRFGALLVVGDKGDKDTNKKRWLCKCDCGNEVWVTAGKLVNGQTNSCGCGRKKYLTGRRFGSLTVIEDSGQRYHGSVVWRCKCDCGNERLVRSGSLSAGSVKNCGKNHVVALEALRKGE